METEEQQELRRKAEEMFSGEAKPGGLESRPVGGHVFRKPDWWWVELWVEKRQLFKEGVAHVLLFAGLLGSLEIAHWLLGKSSLPPEELYWLNKAHFYMYGIILVIFAFSFIIKVLKSEFGKKQK